MQTIFLIVLLECSLKIFSILNTSLEIVTSKHSGQTIPDILALRGLIHNVQKWVKYKKQEEQSPRYIMYNLNQQQTEDPSIKAFFTPA